MIWFFFQELMLTRQLTENEGNVLYEARTEFSYSSDPSKTIIFTTKLEDLSEFGSTNHSYTIGVSQAFTRVDTSISTHVGRSKDKDSVGVLIKYQTSLLQKKNLLLLAEIDKLEKKIILQVSYLVLAYLRNNNAWKPYCVVSFIMIW